MVAADSVYGVGEVEMALRRAGKGYVLGVASTQQFGSWGKQPSVSGTADEIATALPASAYMRLSAGAGSKGPRLYDWAYVELADLDAEAQGYPGSHGTWTRGLLIRRSLADQSLAFFTTWCPKGTPIEGLVQVEVSWTPFFGQAVKLGSPIEEDGPDDGQAEAVCGGFQGEGCS